MTQLTASHADPSVELSVVIPLHNEALELSAFIAEIKSRLTSVQATFQIVLVDDGSTDDTWPCIQSLAQDDARVEGIQLSRNFGKEAALIAGLTHATGSAVITMDGDGQHPPDMLPEFTRVWRSGVDVVEGAKLSRATQSLPSRWASKGFNLFFSQLSEVRLDEASDYRLLSRRAVETLLSLPESSFFYRGLSSWIGFERQQIQFEPAHRRGGESSFSSWSLFKYAVKNTIAFTAAPLQLVTGAGILFLLFAVILGAQTLWLWYAGQAVEGFTTVILLILIHGGVVMTALGLIGQYIAQIHLEVKRRPRYLVRERTDQSPPA